MTVAQLGVFLQPSPLREPVSGDEPMTDAQASYLRSCRNKHASLSRFGKTSQAEASKLIEEMRKKTGVE